MDEVSWAQYVPTFFLPAETPAGPRPLPTLTPVSFAQAETVSQQDMHQRGLLGPRHVRHRCRKRVSLLTVPSPLGSGHS